MGRSTTRDHPSTPREEAIVVDRLLCLAVLSVAFTPAAVVGALPPVLISVATVSLVFLLVELAFGPAPAQVPVRVAWPTES
jgi:hypothetical protein